MSNAADNSFLRLTPLEDSAVKLFFESLSPIQAQLADPAVAEVMINDYRNVWVERRGVMTRLDLELGEAKLTGAIHSLASSVEKSARAGTAQGIINAGHKNLRIASVMRPTAIDGHAMAIRRHRDDYLRLPDYTAMGAFAKVHARDEHAADVHFAPDAENEVLMDSLRELVIQRKNVLVSGGTSTGKTTFLNALGAEIPGDQRVITIEDTQELKLSVPNRLRLLSNEEKGVTPRVLLALCLRFRPDRIIVGELRQGEAYDLLQALNTGHDGGMTSIHATTPRGALTRLESLAMLGVPPGANWSLDNMRRNVADCIDYVVHLRRTGNLRHVSEIVEVLGIENNEYILKRVF